jgi:predicted RNA binding protein YcfA (HicA-like mRNA interferase family)
MLGYVERRPMKVRDVLRRLRTDGWVLARQTGNHRQFKHLTRAGVVTVPGHLSDELKPGTLASIARQAGWTQ